MYINMEGQMMIFLFTVLAGFAIGFFYDLFRILRKSFKHHNFFVQLEDLLFWIIASLGVFLFLLSKNKGEVRFYIILGIFLGAVIYFESLSRIVLPVCVAVIRFAKHLFGSIFKLIMVPFKFIKRILEIPYKHAENSVKRLENRTIVGLRKTKNYVKIKTKKIRSDFGIIFKKI